MSRGRGLVESELLRIMYSVNPWWESGRVPPAKAMVFKRRDYYKLLQRIDDLKIMAVVGPRRVGKTTLMYQLIEQIIVQKGPKRVMYISLDDPYLKMSPESLGEIFELYSKYVLKEPLSQLRDRIYLFLDEVQSLRGWENVLKRWFDLGYGIKFIISGSSSTDIMTGAAESLVGRLDPRVMLPMKFLEVIRYHVEDDSGFNEACSRLRESLQAAVRRQDPSAFFTELRGHANKLASSADGVKLLLDSYLLKGGYPEIVGTEDLYRAAESLRTYLNLTIYKDIVRAHEIRDPKAFEELVSILSKESSQRLNYSKLASELGLKRDTLKAYLHYLEITYLISEMQFYSGSRVKRARREKKIYIIDPGIRNTAISALDEYTLRDAAELGMIVEGVVAGHCRRLKHNLEPSSDQRIFYWKGEKYEVDVVVELLRKPLPIEVKFAEAVREKELRGLKEFMDRFSPPLGIVVTKNLLDLEGRVVYVPLWLFLLIC